MLPPAQATFLRGSSEGGSNAELEAELEALTPEELEARCRRCGVSRKGGKSAQISRLLSLDAYLHGEKQPPAQAAAAAAAADAAAEAAAARAACAAAAGGTSGWADVTDASEEPPRAMSKWERQEEEQGAEGASRWACLGLRGGSGWRGWPSPPCGRQCGSDLACCF